MVYFWHINHTSINIGGFTTAKIWFYILPPGVLGNKRKKKKNHAVLKYLIWCQVIQPAWVFQCQLAAQTDPCFSGTIFHEQTLIEALAPFDVTQPLNVWCHLEGHMFNDCSNHVSCLFLSSFFSSSYNLNMPFVTPGLSNGSFGCHLHPSLRPPPASPTCNIFVATDLSHWHLSKQ